LTFFEQYNELEKQLYAAYPQNVEFKNGLAISYQYLGITHSALGNFQQTLTFFEQYNELEKQLYAAYPQNVAFKNGLALSYQLLGWFHDQKLQNQEKAQSYYRNSQKLLQELIANFPGYVQFQTNLDWVNKQLEE